MQSSVAEIKKFLLTLQNNICDSFKKIDTKASFLKDQWNRELGGGGISRVIESGKVFERGGVNFSHVVGENMPASATAHRPELAGRSFEALGVSIVMHPLNPFVPTSHFNIRFFIATKKDAAPIWWFGGGFDLTPYYGFDEDCIHWHNVAKKTCDPFGKEVYPKLKKWADDYFYLKHRKEARGIGGIFFDDLNEWGFEKTCDFFKSVGNNYLPAYLPIVEKRMHHSYTKQQRDFQLYRRGRYVEFNLVYDRGTLFGLQSMGRTESILVSLPPVVNWKYAWSPCENTPEAQLYTKYLVPQPWAKNEEFII